MLAAISKAFGFSSPPEQNPLMPRQINLSGNILHFSMPENFSQDMPAEDMIESVDLTDKSTYQDDQKFTLIRRWWDFKEKGIFGKEYGSLMMSIYLKEASDSLSVDTLKPLDFIEILMDDVEKGKPDIDEGLMVYSDYFPAYDEQWNSNQRWLKYAQGPLDGTQYTFLYAIPITDKQYIIAEFTSAPNDGIGIRGFIENYTLPFIDKIMETFMVDYVDNNPAKQAVIKAEGPSLQQLIDDKIKQLEESSK